MLWPHEDVASLNEFYGDPRGPNGQVNPEWEAANVVQIIPPYQMVYSGGGVMVHLRVHRKCAETFMAVLHGILAHYKTQAAIEAVRMHITGGADCYRTERGGSRLSVHSWACAIDMDPQHNPYPHEWHPGKGMIPIEVITIFKANGFCWRGEGHDIDPMHFQLCEH